jgi:hypothetical protein
MNPRLRRNCGEPSCSGVEAGGVVPLAGCGRVVTVTELSDFAVGALLLIGSYLLLYWGWRTLLKRRQWRGHGALWFAGMLALALFLVLGLYACVAAMASYG